MKYEFHPEALREFEEAAKYYAECQSDLDVRFIASVEKALARVSESPTLFRVIEGNVRRCLVGDFPYAVLYAVEADHVIVLAIMHCSRKPGYWKRRVSGSD
jgi:plasmid stabilization system protein ParE